MYLNVKMWPYYAIRLYTNNILILLSISRFSRLSVGTGPMLSGTTQVRDPAYPLPFTCMSLLSYSVCWSATIAISPW